MKVNEIFTVEREVSPSIGTNYFWSGLEGGLALLEEGTRSEPGEYRIGAPLKKYFVFKCIEPGEAAIQFAFFRASSPDDLLYEEVLPIQIEKNADLDSTLPGGWSPRRPLTEEDRKLFETVMKGWCGATYDPICVSSQIVAGTNYRFTCKVTTATEISKTYHAIVAVFESLPNEGKPYITDIIRLLGV